jgi:ABC-2 type transport system ATP-binding protein
MPSVRGLNPRAEDVFMIATLEAKETNYLPAAQPVVACLDRVNKCYGPLTALRDVSFRLEAGELVAVLGPNGAGKTTMVRILLGLAQPTSGRARLFGGDPNQKEMRSHVGAMLQVARVPETLKVREHIDLFSSYYPNPLPMSETMAIAGVEDIANKKFGDLSGGQRQRVLFALAICGDPDLLFLDEPTVGLDVEARRMLWAEIRKMISRGKTVLLTTHYLEEADALADRVVVINRGSIIAEGAPAEIKGQTAGRRIRCASSLEAATVRRFAGVVDVRQDREVLEIRATEAEPVVRELLARDERLSGLEVTSAGLEDAFLALTREDDNSNNHSEVGR